MPINHLNSNRLDCVQKSFMYLLIQYFPFSIKKIYHFVFYFFKTVFENREKMVLVMEFAAGGELYDYLSERKVLSEEEARRVFRQISTAVYYCHKHKICHRDLKLENILLDENGNAKVREPPEYAYFSCDKFQWRLCRSLFVHFACAFRCR